MQLFLNNWASRLASPLASAALTMQIPVEDAARLVGLGAGDHYLLTLIAVDGAGVETVHEIVRATAVAGDLVTIARAQEGTPAADWSLSARIEARYTAASAAAPAAAMASHITASDPHPQYSSPAKLVGLDVAVLPAEGGALRTSTDGDPRGPYAVDLQMTRTSADQVATDAGDVIGGGESNKVSGGNCVVCGGIENLIDGAWGSAIIGGYGNKVTSYSGEAVLCGGSGNVMSGYYGFLGGGFENTVSGYAAALLGGEDGIADGDYSVVLGGSGATARGVEAAVVMAHTGRSTGARQVGLYAPFRATDATHQGGPLLQSGNVNQTTVNGTYAGESIRPVTASANNTMAMPDNSAYAFTAQIVARSTAGEVSAWRVDGLAARGDGAATVALVGTPTVELLAQTPGAAAWAVAVVADTALGSVLFNVSGGAGLTQWSAGIRTVEVVDAPQYA